MARAAGGLALMLAAAALLLAAVETGRELERQAPFQTAARTPELRSAVAAEGSLRIALWQTAISAVALAGLALTVHYARKAWAAAQESADADNAALIEARVASGEARRTATLAEEANRISREALTADQRPWLSISDIYLSEPITFHPQNGWSIPLAFRFSNVGRTPAFNVMPHFRALVLQNMDLPSIHRDFSDGIRARPDAFFGQTIFPGQAGEQAVSVSITPDEFEAAIPFPDDMKLLHPTIVGVISYRSAGGPTHLTGFQLVITMADKRSVVVPREPSEGYVVGPVQLMKQPWGWFAD